jgi:hypothetical protein
MNVHAAKCTLSCPAARHAGIMRSAGFRWRGWIACGALVALGGVHRTVLVGDSPGATPRRRRSAARISGSSDRRDGPGATP